MSRPIHHVTIDEVTGKCQCPDCHKTFAEKSSLTRHINNNVCKKPKLTMQKLAENIEQIKTDKDASDSSKINQDVINTLKANMETMERFMKLMGGMSTTQTQSSDTQAPIIYNNNNNQNLNILCLGSKDNLLDMLSASEGLPLALSFLKDCALARLAGDCRILQKAYQLETEQAAIQYVNKTKNKYVYYDERRRRTVENNAKVMAKKLADILQRSYLKGMECFKTGLSDQLKDIEIDSSQSVAKQPPVGVKMPELDPYDLHLWNEHVHELNDEKYQKRLLNSLKIPIEPNRE